jgi:acyl carrier protein
MSEVEQKIFTLLRNTKGGKEVTRNSTWEDLGVDSLDVAEFFMEVEKELAVVIPDSEAEKMKTVGEIIDYVEREKKKKAGGGGAPAGGTGPG